jgi:ubiquinone/menaquinone biosynthesis C-methylase UbiE
MNDPVKWRDVWADRAAASVSDYELDRGTSPRQQEIEDLSKLELLAFIDPRPADIILDVGCGTGVNLFLLHGRVRRMIGMDCASGALDRCRRRVEADKIENVELISGDATHLPSPDNSVDKVVCMSVLQYLDDSEVRTAMKEFARVLRSDGRVILHVKNKSSLYLWTLCAAKKLKKFLGRKTQSEYFRPYGWYVTELKDAGLEVVAYNSFNLFMIESMPKKWLLFLQKLELKRHNQFPFRIGFLRRHGAELKIKARPVAG